MAVRLLIAGVLLCVGAWIGLVTAGSEASASAPAQAIAPNPDDPIWAAWDRGPHSHTYDLGKGPNTYCSKCHSPRNWDPAARIDPAPNCVSCKFSFDRAPRVAKGNPPVAEKDWKSIGCDVCHRVQGSTVDPRLAWWNGATGSYETVHNPTALCSKCHLDNDTLRHRRDLGTSTHIGFGCTTCHDAHSAEASCSTSACHPELKAPGKAIPGHDSAHREVSCDACHDASGMTAGPDESNRWVIIRTTELMGRSTTKAYRSHNLQRKVNCERCHFPANSWGLRAVSDLPSQGTPPAGSRPSQAGGQAGNLTLVIARPGEGETLYAGPPVLLHSVPVSGFVDVQGEDISQVQLSLEVSSGGRSVGRQVIKPQPDGAFSFGVTVNPDASTGDFPPEKASCETCHIRSDISLPSGASTLKVTATTASGRKAEAVRQIQVDRAGQANVPARVILADDSSRTVTGVTVSGTTWLFQWRTRIGAATTDRSGMAHVQVEALATAPTHYAFQVEPSVVGRVMYEGLEPVQVTLPAGATDAPPITLRVRSRLGAIEGAIKNSTKETSHPIGVSAILLPEGQRYRTTCSSSGSFAFSELPVGEYLLIVDRESQELLGRKGTTEAVDLSVTGRARVSLLLEETGTRTWTGTVQDEAGRPLPFAWIGTDGAVSAGPVDPVSGSSTMRGLPADSRAVIATAPGYYSQAQPLPPDGDRVAYTLARRPETRAVPWGSGEVVVPPESEASVAPGRITLDQGWVWGHGGGEIISLTTSHGTIRLADGEFALEAAPQSAPILYVKEGRAMVSPRGNGEPVEVRAGQMLFLSEEQPLRPVAVDPEVAIAMKRGGEQWMPPVWQLTAEAQVRDRLAWMGIGTAQVITLVTYSVAGLFLLLLPLPAVIWWWRWRKGSPRRDSRGICE